MLPAMLRFALPLAFVAACSCSKSSEKASAAPPPATPPAGDKAPVAAKADPPPASPSTDDPSRHLQPDEGTLTIGKGEAAVGAEATIPITVKPAAGYHVSKNYPTKLTLDAPPGVKLAKSELAKADAATFNEKSLQFAVKATPEKAGTYEIKGWFKFGVCDPSSCHPKKQPIAIQVAAN